MAVTNEQIKSKVKQIKKGECVICGGKALIDNYLFEICASTSEINNINIQWNCAFCGTHTWLCPKTVLNIL